MVPENTPHLEMDESLYEEIIVRKDDPKQRNLTGSTKTTRNARGQLNENRNAGDGAIDNNSDEEDNYTTILSSDSVDIYEVIPAERELQMTREPSLSRTSSISSTEGKKNSNDGCLTPKSRTYSSCSSGSESNDEATPAVWKKDVSCCSPDTSTTQYAEILSSTNIIEYTPSRRTRESENPILKLGFAPFCKSGTIKQLCQLRKTPDLLVEGSDSLAARSFGPVYENTPKGTPSQSPKPSPNHSPRSVHSQSGRLYENVEFPLTMESDCESRRSSVSAELERQSLSSEGSSREMEIAMYENIPGEEKPRTRSTPLDIVYSDLDFTDNNNRRQIERCVSVPLSRNLSTNPHKSPASNSLPLGNKPTPPPARKNGISRPKSMVVFNSSGASLGFHIAKFVGSVAVQRSNDHTLQAAMHDSLRRSHEEDSTLQSVNVEVTNEFVRISTNCSPWEVIASCDIDQIGYVNLYEQDASVLGLISCLPRQEPRCYILRSADAPTIFQAIKNVFNSPEPRIKSFRFSSSAHLGPENWLEDTDEVQTFNSVTYLGSHRIRKSLLSIKDSIRDMLNKISPKDFTSVSVEVRCNEIHILDGNDEALLGKHLVPWVLSMGVFEEDPRLFGYIVTEARQGERTRMYCHAFRCGRITSAAAVTEAVRVASQATYGPRKESIGSLSRRGSQLSRTPSVSLGSTSGDNEEEEHEDKSSIDKIHKEHNKSRRIKDLPVFRKLSKKDSPKNRSSFKSHIQEAAGRNNSNSSVEDFVVVPSDIVEEKVYNFEATYLCSTVVNPPLRPKHVRDCVKQHQKQTSKLFKRLGVTKTTNDVKMDVGADGVAMYDTLRPDTGQRFFPFSDISLIKSHPDYPEFFAFSTVVTGDTKHKCHLFKQTAASCSTDVIRAFESFM